MTIAAATQTTGFAFIPWVDDRAFSEEARTLDRLIDAASKFSESITVGEPKRTAQEALDVAYKTALVEDWDGEGSARVEPSTYSYAKQFLNLLLGTVPVPEIVPETDGDIMFEWDFGRRLVFSISIGRDGTLTYAGLFGYRKIHGTEHLREALPLVISESFERLGAWSGR